MALRKFLFIESTEGYHEEGANTDSLVLGGLGMSGSIVMNQNKVTGAGAATTAGDALVYGQVSASLTGLTSTADVVMSGFNITGLPSTPSDSTAATSKAYVDAVAQGLDVHGSVRCATTSSMVLATAFENGDYVDGVLLATGDRVLIKDQSTGTENGVYVVNTSGAPTRATDWVTGYAAAGAFTFVEEGSLSDSGWVCTNNQGSDITNTDALVFSQFSGAGQIDAGAGLTKLGNTIDVGAGNGISVAANSVAVNPDVTTTTATTATAILVGANGVAIAVDNSTIEGSLAGAGAESLRLKDGGVTGAKLDPAINIITTGSGTFGGNITSTGGIFYGNGSGLTNLPSAATASSSLAVQHTLTVSGWTAFGNPVYVSANNTVSQADTSPDAKARVVGVSLSGSGGTVSFVEAGIAQGVLAGGGSAGTPYYLATGGGLTTSVPGSNNRVIQVGKALNANDLLVQIIDYGKKA